MEGTHSAAAPPDAPLRLSEFMENGCVPSGTVPASHPFGHSDHGFFNSWQYKFTGWWLENINSIYQCPNDPDVVESTFGVELLGRDSAAMIVDHPSLPHNSYVSDTQSPWGWEGQDVRSIDHGHTHSDCNEPDCTLAKERIKAVWRARALAGTFVAEYGTLDRDLEAAHCVLHICSLRKLRMLMEAGGLRGLLGFCALFQGAGLAPFVPTLVGLPVPPQDPNMY